MADKKTEDISADPVSEQKPIGGVATPPGADAPAEEGADKKGKKGKKKNPQEELDATSIYVKVYSPYQTFYDGQAISISAENDTGPFDILPRHHNFMTLVNTGDVIIRICKDEEKKIRIARGVMHVRSNKVTLFLDV